MSDTKLKGSMTQGNPTRSLVMFALPMIAGNLFQQLYNIVDSIIVGNAVGPDALAAIGASTAITLLFVMVAQGAGIGCSVVISQLFGARKIETMKTAISTALISILIFSLTLSVAGRLLSSSILTWMNTPADVFEGAAVYLNIYFYGFFFLFMYNTFSAIFNALGDSIKPLIFLIFSSALNVGLDLWFVIGFHWGIAGAAWATLIAQGVSALLSFLVLAYKLMRMESGQYRRYDAALMKDMIHVAVPTVLQQAIISIGSLLIQSCVNSFGSTFLAGYTAALKIDGIAIVPMVNIGNAVSTYVAQNIGAGKYERIKGGYRTGIAMVILVGGIMGVLMQFFGTTFVGLFMDTGSAKEAIAVGARYISIISIFYFVMGSMNVTGAVLRGAGDMKWFMSATFMNLLLRVILVWTLADITAGNVIMWASPVGWAAAFCISYVRYKQGGWKKVKLIR